VRAVPEEFSSTLLLRTIDKLSRSCPKCFSIYQVSAQMPRTYSAVSNKTSTYHLPPHTTWFPTTSRSPHRFIHWHDELHGLATPFIAAGFSTTLLRRNPQPICFHNDSSPSPCPQQRQYLSEPAAHTDRAPPNHPLKVYGLWRLRVSSPEVLSAPQRPSHQRLQRRLLPCARVRQQAHG
jgi:hypothetical protein